MITLKDKQQEFSKVLMTLEALSPLKVMDRGYSLAYTENQQIIKSVNQIKEDDRIRVQVADGNIICEVKEIGKE